MTEPQKPPSNSPPPAQPAPARPSPDKLDKVGKSAPPGGRETRKG
jgi:hypothetical protein